MPATAFAGATARLVGPPQDPSLAEAPSLILLPCGASPGAAPAPLSLPAPPPPVNLRSDAAGERHVRPHKGLML